MKKFAVITLCAVMALSFAACSNSAPAKDNTQKQNIEKNIEIPSPFIDCDTMDAAGKIAGFIVTLPDKMPEGYAQKSIQAVENKMVQVFYENGENDLTIRKAKGNEDISGDYNEYKEGNTLTVGNLKASVKGNGGKINTATWVDGEYSYSVTVNLGKTGLDAAAIRDMMSTIR